ncbi:hypothetical protein ARC78_05740 [Stenotrophomonas pictorum JCM 9942]|uniref:Transmembrane protein n=1 Tax=Stenotrophomonas pictorum JCM 9942 TaxID=1236960 RepID=A0A0R0APD8_9GAMM|nr:hypothetical protein [Stenotrophomonas pictorum]KRG44290.1 hypothetical protein ARC78_05740 [Stenotrophomonas pictorum JCM 9942]
MRYRLSGKLILFLHVVAMVPISIAYGAIDGGTWLPPILYVGAMICMWGLTLPGAKRGLVFEVLGFYYQFKMFRENGFKHFGHARREDWDRYGRTSRVLLHALALITILAFMSGGKIGSDWFWQCALLGTSFAIGIESGTVIFRSGEAPRRRN